MRLPSTKGATVLAVLFMMSTSPSGRAQNETFTVTEATIADIHAAMKRGTLTAARLVRIYLARIEAYDQTGPSLNAVIMVNPDAVARAEELDVRFEQAGLTGPLHGIPILLKDNVNTADMPTTGGSLSLEGSIQTLSVHRECRAIRRGGDEIFGHFR